MAKIRIRIKYDIFSEENLNILGIIP